MPECPRDPHESAASRPLSELKAALSGAQNQLQEGHVKENPQSSGSPWPRGLSDIFWQTLNHQSRQNITNFGMIASGISKLYVNGEGNPPSVPSAVPPWLQRCRSVPGTGAGSEPRRDPPAARGCWARYRGHEGAAGTPACALPPVIYTALGISISAVRIDCSERDRFLFQGEIRDRDLLYILHTLEKPDGSVNVICDLEGVCSIRLITLCSR